MVAGACVLVVVLLTAVAGFLAEGSPGALGALIGGSVALVFFLGGSLVVNAATRLAPQASILIALMTLLLQVALIAAVFIGLDASSAVGSTISAGWIAGGVIAAAAAWIVGQLYASAKARIPAYDIDLPVPGERTAPEPAHAREVGAP